VIETGSRKIKIGIENRLREEVRKDVCKFWLKALTPKQLKGEGGESGRKTVGNPNTAGPHTSPPFTSSIRCHLFNSFCPISIFSVSMGTF
jgi:hypothetical protein